MATEHPTQSARSNDSSSPPIKYNAFYLDASKLKSGEFSMDPKDPYTRTDLTYEKAMGYIDGIATTLEVVNNWKAGELDAQVENEVLQLLSKQNGEAIGQLMVVALKK
jgi:hypothetical protein